MPPISPTPPYFAISDNVYLLHPAVARPAPLWAALGMKESPACSRGVSQAKPSTSSLWTRTIRNSRPPILSSIAAPWRRRGKGMVGGVDVHRSEIRTGTRQLSMGSVKYGTECEREWAYGKCECVRLGDPRSITIRLWPWRPAPAGRVSGPYPDSVRVKQPAVRLRFGVLSGVRVAVVVNVSADGPHTQLAHHLSVLEPRRPHPNLRTKVAPTVSTSTSATAAPSTAYRIRHPLPRLVSLLRRLRLRVPLNTAPPWHRAALALFAAPGHERRYPAGSGTAAALSSTPSAYSRRRHPLCMRLQARRHFVRVAHHLVDVVLTARVSVDALTPHCAHHVDRQSTARMGRRSGGGTARRRGANPRYIRLSSAVGCIRAASARAPLPRVGCPSHITVGPRAAISASARAQRYRGGLRGRK
ncbi:hypothetical protein DFH06DRAFT_444178 [Mycena polygramma]|nr:hypothetical protein DFH06DRAFT_444178 [Mycena polygramma]